MLNLTNMKRDLRWAVDGPPIGLWQTVCGTADMLMQDTLWLLPGGKGHLQTRSVLRGVEHFPVLWRHVEPGALLMRMIFPDGYLDEEEDYPDDDPDAEPEWDRVEYCADTVKIDVAGVTVHVLHTVGYKEFWGMTGPIGFISPIDGLTLPSFVQDSVSYPSEGGSG